MTKDHQKPGEVKVGDMTLTELLKVVDKHLKDQKMRGFK